MTGRTFRPEMPGAQPSLTRASQGTGNFFATVARSRVVGKRRLYDIRSEGGDLIPGCDAVVGGPKDDPAWVGARVVAMTLESGKVVIVGPVSEDNEAVVQSVAPTPSQTTRPSESGEGDRLIEANDIRLIFGHNPRDLTIEVPGLLRIEAQGIRFSRGGATGEKVVMWGPFVSWAVDACERINAHDAWIVQETVARPVGSLAPATLFVGGEVTAPGEETAVDAMTVPENA